MPVARVVLVAMLVMAANLAVFDFMMVEAEKPLDKKHRHQPGEHPEHDGKNRFMDRQRRGSERLLQRMRQHMQQPHTEHHASDKTDSAFHHPMRQPKPNGDHPADDRRAEDEQAVVGQEDEWVHGKLLRRVNKPPVSHAIEGKGMMN